MSLGQQRAHLVSKAEREAAIEHGQHGREIHDRQRLPCAAAGALHERQEAPRLDVTAARAASHSQHSGLSHCLCLPHKTNPLQLNAMWNFNAIHRGVVL